MCVRKKKTTTTTTTRCGEQQIIVRIGYVSSSNPLFLVK